MVIELLARRALVAAVSVRIHFKGRINELLRALIVKQTAFCHWAVTRLELVNRSQKAREQ